MIVVYQEDSNHRWLDRAFLPIPGNDRPPVYTRCGAERRSEADETTECKKQGSAG